LAALPLEGGGEIIYVGMYGATDGGSILAGHVLSATFLPGSTSNPTWNDLTLNPATNDQRQLNYYGLDVSSIFIDPHDTRGNTVYVTIAGFADPLHAVRVAYRSTDGGAHWVVITSNLPSSPANSIVIDPMDANTAYLATDNGVYATRQISTCGLAASNCWSSFGTGLPHAPVVQLSAAPPSASMSVLVAATYGRGVWQIPLWTAGTQLTTASVSSPNLTFATQPVGTASGVQTVTLINTGGIALLPTAIAVSGDFTETDNCANASVSAGASCAIQVTFAPSQTGDRAGQLTINANVASGQFTMTLNGTGATAGVVNLSPGSVNFGQVAVGSTSDALQVTVENSGGTAVALSSVGATAPFMLASNACGSLLAANSDCQLTVKFQPTQAGSANGTLAVVLGTGTQTVALSGTGASVATDALAPTALSFPATAMGQLSAAQNVVLTNDGDLSLTAIAVSVSAGFQTSNNCGTALGGHSSCSISVIFAPTQAGSQTGKLTVADAQQSQMVALSGTGAQPAVIGVSPTQLSFASQMVATASAPLTLTVSNAGGVPMANVGFQITGVASGSFATATTTCGATLSAGSSCTVQVVFTPVTVGGQTAVLAVTSSARCYASAGATEWNRAWRGGNQHKSISDDVLGSDLGPDERGTDGDNNEHEHDHCDGAYADSRKSFQPDAEYVRRQSRCGCELFNGSDLYSEHEWNRGGVAHRQFPSFCNFCVDGVERDGRSSGAAESATRLAEFSADRRRLHQQRTNGHGEECECDGAYRSRGECYKRISIG